MHKTDRQKLLEVEQGKTIREILEGALEKHRGKRHYSACAALELDISMSTLHKWTEMLDIDLRSYAADDDTLVAASPAS